MYSFCLAYFTPLHYFRIQRAVARAVGDTFLDPLQVLSHYLATVHSCICSPLMGHGLTVPSFPELLIPVG